MNEQKALKHLKGLLKAAENENWNLGRMHVIDGYLAAINDLTGKEYGFSGTDIYLCNGREQTEVIF